ncbi:MAG: hypothetical protein K5799_05650 [Erythrobacter sp.]|nr:hypothetical protein [Erythrobacter sp.]
MQNDNTTFIVIVAAIVVLALLAVWLVTRRKRTAHLRDTFGEEYDRTVREHGRSDAERNLEEREKRVSDFRIRPLTIAERDRFAGDWKEVKALFVDSPQEAMLRGDRLLADMMQTRGFPMADFDRRYEDLSVNHGRVAHHYREGHEIAERRAEATTEEMRRALKNYEHLFDELVSHAGAEPTAVSQDGGDVDSGVWHGDQVTISQTTLGQPIQRG